MKDWLITLLCFLITGMPYLLVFIKRFSAIIRLLFVSLLDVYIMVSLPIISTIIKRPGLSAFFFPLEIFLSAALALNVLVILTLWIVSKVQSPNKKEF